MFGQELMIVWIFFRGNIKFQSTHHLLNPWNEGKRVQISRDGQVTASYYQCKVIERSFLPTE